MLGAYKTGIISEERMTEALTRILGLKAHLGLNKKGKEELVPQPETVEEVLQREEYKAMQKSISEDCITLVKYKDKDVLPMTPDRYKRIMIVHIKGAENSMSALMKMLGGGKGNPAEALKVGISYIPESRQTQGLVLDKTVENNIILPRIKQYTNKMGIVVKRRQREEVQKWIDILDVRPNNPNMLASQLSGGNQQKVVIAKWLSTNNKNYHH